MKQQNSGKQIISRLNLTRFERFLIFLGFKNFVENLLIKKKLKEVKSYEN